MLNPDQKTLIEFVEVRSLDLPLWLRIQIYRGLADLLPDRSARQSFVSRAQLLEETEARCARLNCSIGTPAIGANLSSIEARKS
jgi:hypothetical protein